MASFYGNMKNNSRASFIFDKIYPNRVAMEKALNAVDNEGTFIGDGIFINRYVLVDYHYALGDKELIISQQNIDDYYSLVDSNIVSYSNVGMYYVRTVEEGAINYTKATSYVDGGLYYEQKVFVDRYKVDNDIANNELENATGNLIETDLYYQHRYEDWEAYKASYDSTVWMKIYADGKERYIMVAELDAKAPILEIIDDAPGCYNGNAHFDVRASTDLNYLYFIPKNWDFVVNEYTPTEEYKYIEVDNNLVNIDNYKNYYIKQNNEYIVPSEYNEEITYYTENIKSNNYWYYQQEQDKHELWFAKYILTEDEVVLKNKDYFALTFELVPNLPISQSIKNLHYYNQIAEDIYIPTEDVTVQENTDYYKLIKVEKQILPIGTEVNNLGYKLYQLNSADYKNFNSDVEYPYFNAAGFDSKVSTHVPQTGSGISINKVKSSLTYPAHKFTHAGALTIDTYLPNRYYKYNGPKVPVEQGHIYNLNYAYYIAPKDTEYNESTIDLFKYVPLVLRANGLYQPGTPLTDPNTETYYYDQDITNKNYFVKTKFWEYNTAYYEITWVTDKNKNKITDHEDDTYRIDIYLPELGNTVASIYDIIYGVPVIQEDKQDGYNNLIGYCSTSQLLSYNLIGYCTAEERELLGNSGDLIHGDYGIGFDYKFNLPYYNNTNPNNIIEITVESIAAHPYADEEYEFPVYLMDGQGDYWASNRIFYLTDEQFDQLSPEIYPGVYDIPVYLKEGSNVRPYNQARLLSNLTPPYDNLQNDNVSIGWVLTLLKRYLSELRYIAYGKDEEGNQVGIQSDWTQENDELIGYIQHRPVLITNFTKTTDKFAVANKIYYKEDLEINPGEISYVSLSSDHYELLTAKDYNNLGYYYQTRRDAVKKINSENCDIAVESTIYNVIEEDSNRVNAENYLNYWIKENENMYVKPTSYQSKTYYYIAPIGVNDYSNWFYAKNIIQYIEITEQNKLPEGYNGSLYKDNNGTSLVTVNDFISDEENHIYYLYDFNNDGNIDLSEQITQENQDDVKNLYNIYTYKNYNVIPEEFIGYYYAISSTDYDPITINNYNNNNNKIYYVDNDNNIIMYKYNNGNYEEIQPIDYSGKFYLTEDIQYSIISEENYARERQKYKKVSASDYELITLRSFIDTLTIGESNVSKYYILRTIDGQLKYTGIEEKTIEDLSRVDDNNIPIYNIYDIYIIIPGQLRMSQDLTLLGYTVYELPRTTSNNIEKDRDRYIQCSDYSIFNSNTKYYIWNGTRYIEAVYTNHNYDIEPVEADYINDSLVQWNYGYQLTLDDNNIITSRTYSNCLASTLFDNNKSIANDIALYHNVEIDNSWKMKSVNTFSIIINNNNNLNEDTADIHESIGQMKTLKRAELLTYLNNTLVNNYGAIYRIDTSYDSWPVKDTELNDIGFYYASLQILYKNYKLDQAHFDANKSRYYTIEKVPIEQTDYEIHNIWNSVLELVQREP